MKRGCKQERKDHLEQRLNRGLNTKRSWTSQISDLRTTKKNEMEIQERNILTYNTVIKDLTCFGHLDCSLMMRNLSEFSYRKLKWLYPHNVWLLHHRGARSKEKLENVKMFLLTRINYWDSTQQPTLPKAQQKHQLQPTSPSS